MKESEFHLVMHTANSNEVFNDQSQLEIEIDYINIIRAKTMKVLSKVLTKQILLKIVIS